MLLAIYREVGLLSKDSSSLRLASYTGISHAATSTAIASVHMSCFSSCLPLCRSFMRRYTPSVTKVAIPAINALRRECKTIHCIGIVSRSNAPKILLRVWRLAHGRIISRAAPRYRPCRRRKKMSPSATMSLQMAIIMN